MNQQVQHKIIACVDESHFADCVTDYAAWAAQCLGQPLELLHMLANPSTHIDQSKDHSGVLTFRSQQKLLTDLSDRDLQKSKIAREEGRILLNRLRMRVMETGVEAVDTKLRYGKLDDALVKQENQAGLFILGRRGLSAESNKRDIGRQVEKVVRALSKPILTVTDQFKVPSRVLIAFDNSSMTKKAVHLVASSPLFSNLTCYVVMSGKERSDMENQLAWAHNLLLAANRKVKSFYLPSETEQAISETIEQKQIDLLVMGAYGHSFWRNLIFGSTTTELLRKTHIPTLLVR